MTGPEWSEAFDRGNPARLAQALTEAIHQAHREQVASEGFASADLGMLGAFYSPSDLELVQPLMVRAGVLLREQGWIAK